MYRLYDSKNFTCEQKFHLETDSSRMNFVIYTYQDNETAYLIPSTEVGSYNIVAMVQPDSASQDEQGALRVLSLPHRPSTPT